MKQKFFKRLAAAAVLLLGATTATAHDFEVDGIYYNRNSDGTSVSVTYKGKYFYDEEEYSGAVTIPSEVTCGGTTYSVTSIGEYAFSDCSGLTSVVIGNSVTSISRWAFSDCSGLTSVVIGNSVTSIGSYAFRLTGLKTLSIPKSVTMIDDEAFHGSWDKIVFEDGDKEIRTRWSESPTSSEGTHYYVYSIFSYCSVDSLYMGRNFLPPEHYDENGNSLPGLFADTYGTLKHVEIGDSVTYIADYLFEGCYLKSIKIGRNLSEIGQYSFENCYLEKVEISDLAAWCKVSDYSHLLSHAASLYIEGVEIEDLVIPSTVSTINRGVFYGSKLKSVTIGDNVKLINYDAFGECKNLEKVIITNLNAWCNIDFKSTSSNPLFSAHHLWLNGEEIIDLKIPDTLSAIKEYTFSGYSGLKSVEIPNSVTSIGSSAFYDCDGLTSVEIPNSVISIGSYAFYDCDGLTSVEIPNSVISIGSYAFYDCDGLTTVEIPNSVTSIGRSAFYDCSNLKIVFYNATNSTSGGYGFDYGCTFIIGENVTNLPDKLFYYPCKIVSHAAEPPVITGNTFSSGSTLYVSPDAYLAYWMDENWGKMELVEISTLISSIALNLEEYSITPNGSIQLTAQITPLDATLKDIYWRSDNQKVASVDPSGLVQGLSEGEATITAMAIDGSGVVASCHITVGEVANISLELDPSEITIERNKTAVIKPVFLPAGTSIRPCEWSCSDENIVKYKANSDGSITIIGATDGEAIITCHTTDGSDLTATCTVTVDTGTGVEGVSSTAAKVRGENGVIRVEGVDGARVEVFNTAGVCIYSGTDTEIYVPQRGLYVVKVAGRATKLAL